MTYNIEYLDYCGLTNKFLAIEEVKIFYKEGFLTKKDLLKLIDSYEKGHLEIDDIDEVKKYSRKHEKKETKNGR